MWCRRGIRVPVASTWLLRGPERALPYEIFAVTQVVYQITDER